MKVPPVGALRAPLALGIGALLAGCASLESPPPGEGAGDLLAFYSHAANLEPDRLAAAYRRFQNWTREDRCHPDRLRLVMLIMNAEGGPAAEADPSKVLAPCLDEKGQARPYLRHLALILDEPLRQRRHIHRLREQRKKLEQELLQSRQQLQAVERERDKLQKRTHALEKQLEALKDIERSIRKRNQAPNHW